jgi:glucose/arabinose dehydrogenase
LCISALGLSGCDDLGGDPRAQIGPHPNLPEPTQYLLPPTHIARVVGWNRDETPAVAQGLQIHALATGLERLLYVLPNGDVLVVESKSAGTQPNKRPKDLIMGWFESWATSGGDTGASNRITLLRDSNGDGAPEVRSVLLDHLQLALWRGPGRQRPLRRQHRRDRQISLCRRRYQKHGAGHDTHTAARWPDRSPLDKEPGRPGADGSLLYVGVGSNSNIGENGIEAERDRAAILEVDRATGRSRIFASACAIPTGSVWSRRPARCGRSSTSATNWDPIWCRII